MIDIAQLNRLHAQTVAEWHERPIANPYEGVWSVICSQHAFNFRLWHQEDIARRRDVDDSQIASVKREIDSLNQQRNDWIEKIDDWLVDQLAAADVRPTPDAPINTETPGSAIDRLSIMSLRIYHLDEQLQRDDVDTQHRSSVEQKLALCHVQRTDLSQSLEDLLVDLRAGNKRHRVYRQMKMYNDPTLNPYLYKQLKRAG